MLSRRWRLGEVFVLRHAGFPFDWLEELGLSDAALEAVDGEGSDAARALYERERATLRARLHERASDPRVQEAVFLSSPDMFENVWAPYVAARPQADNSKVRRVERQVYSYLQRLCAKNETASFFGPMGYGEIDGGEGIRVERRTPRRRTFLAFWAVQELAQAITSDPAVWMLLPLRRNPVFRVEGDRAVCPSAGKEVALSGPQRALLERMGTARGPLEPADLGDAMPLLLQGVLLRELPIRANDAEAFGTLLEALRALLPAPPAQAWLERLAPLEALRAAFETGDLAARRRLLPQLEATLTAITGKPARRGEGLLYVDRLAVYEEACSQFAMKIGAREAERLAEQLSGGLELSAAYGEHLQRRFQEEIAAAWKDGAPDRMELLDYGERFAPEAGVTSQRFTQLPPLASEDDVPPSSGGGRYALPDVCLGRRPDGSFDVLLARLHHHLLLWSWLGIFFPDRDRFEGAARRWLEREPTVVALSLGRRNKGFYVFPGRRLMCTAFDPLEPGEAPLAVADAGVQLEGGRPVLRDRAGNALLLYLPLADFTTFRPYAALAHPLVLHAPIRAPSPLTPRVRVGGAMYQRARWEADLSPLQKLGGFDLLRELRRLARAQGWPRFVFARVAGERKPFLVDTRSPFSAELLKHLAHGATSFEEMCPAPEELWLRDERGRYTFELRMQAER